MEKSLNHLAKRIEERLGADNNKFSDLAFEELESFNFDIPLHDFEQNISEWMIKTELPKQLNVYNSFGQPPVTFFNNGVFAIDIYFWLQHDTSIHDHSFSGAFKILYGRSLQEEFSIKCLKEYAPDVMSTEVNRKESVVVGQGHVQKIKNGKDFTHRLIHLDQPTITLCVRTVNDHSATQWHHFQNGLSIHRLSDSEEAIKKVFYYQYLSKQNEEASKHFLSAIIKKWTISTTMNIYEQMASGSLGVSDEVIDFFYQELSRIYEKTEWLKIYEQFYQTMQENFVEFEEDTPGTRVIAHAVNSNLSQEECTRILHEVYPEEIPPEYLEVLLSAFTFIPTRST